MSRAKWVLLCLVGIGLLCLSTQGSLVMADSTYALSSSVDLSGVPVPGVEGQIPVPDIPESGQWPMFHGNLESWGYTDKVLTLPLPVLFTQTIGTSYSSPTVADYVVYVGNNMGSVYAYDLRDGALLWETDVERKVKTAPAISGDYVIVATYNTTFGLNRTTGSVIWAFEPNNPLLTHDGYFIDSSPKIADNVVYSGLGDGRLYALDIVSGNELWNYSVSGPIKCTPAVYEDLLFFGAGHGGVYHDPTFYAVNRTMGTLEWSVAVDYDTVSSPTVRDGIVFFGSRNIVYALNVSTGGTEWTYPITSNEIIESSPAISPSAVFICGGDWSGPSPVGALYSLNISTGGLNWQVDANYTRISPVVANNTVFLGTYNSTYSRLTARNCTDGGLLWSYTTSHVILSVPAVAHDLLIFASGGILHVVGPDTFSPSVRDIAHASPILEASDSQLITATITDISGVSVAIVYHRVNGGSWSPTPMANPTADTYEASLSGFNHNDFVEYYLWTNDTNNFSGTEDNEGVFYSFTVQDTTAPSWDQVPSDIVLGSSEILSYDLNATDYSGISTWWLNNTAQFTIDANGIITNITRLTEGVWGLQVWVNDSYNNVLTATFTITGDYVAPIWHPDPTNQTVELGTPFTYDLDAIDFSGVDTWWVNDSTHFSIDGNGLLRNASFLNVGTYGLLVTVTDTFGNIQTSSFTITVQDTSPPSWVTQPTDQILQVGESLDYQLSATDLSGISQWTINDTTHFSISTTGRITSIETLEVGGYGILVTVIDTFDNQLTATFTVTVKATPPLPPPPPGVPGFPIEAIILGLVIVLIPLTLYRQRKNTTKSNE